MFVALPIEIKNREFDSRLYLAVKLLERGIKCVIGNKPEVNDFCCSCGEQYVYVGKSMSLNTYKDVKKTGGKFTILDEEGGVYFKDYESTLNLRTPDEVLKHVDMYYSWGLIQRDFLLTHRKNISESEILVTGNPRFDLSKAEFYPYHSAISAESSDFPKGYILFSMRFKRYNHQLGDDGQGKFTKYMKKNKAALLKSNKLYSEDRNKRDRDYQAELFSYYIEAIKTLSNSFKDQNIVIRPHPTENIETYKKIFSTYKNVYVSREGSIFEWLANAKLVIHHDCTTGLEAMLHGLPTVSYTPIFDEDLTQWLPTNAGFRINSLNELVKNIKDHVIDSYDKSYFLARYDIGLIKAFIANVDFNSAEMIAESIKEKINMWQSEGWELGNIILVKKLPFFVKVLRRVGSLFGVGLPLYKEIRQVNKLKKNKFSELSFNEVEAKLNAFLNMSGCTSFDVKIQAVGKNSYCLEKI